MSEETASIAQSTKDSSSHLISSNDEAGADVVDKKEEKSETDDKKKKEVNEEIQSDDGEEALEKNDDGLDLSEVERRIMFIDAAVAIALTLLILLLWTLPPRQAPKSIIPCNGSVRIDSNLEVSL